MLQANSTTAHGIDVYERSGRNTVTLAFIVLIVSSARGRVVPVRNFMPCHTTHSTQHTAQPHTVRYKVFTTHNTIQNTQATQTCCKDVRKQRGAEYNVWGSVFGPAQATVDTKGSPNDASRTRAISLLPSPPEYPE